jgi:hypothetical protein
MERRAVLLGGLMFTVYGCDALTDDASVTLPTEGTTRMLAYSSLGKTMGEVYLVAPHLALYADGTAVCGARYRSSVPLNEVRQIVGEVRHALAGQPPTVMPRPGNVIMDGSTTIFDVLAADRSRQTVRVYALKESGDHATLRRALERMGSIVRKVVDSGEPYQAQGIRVVADRNSGSGPADNWPADIPVLFDGKQASPIVDLRDPAIVQKIIAAFPIIPNTSNWHTVRLPGAAHYASVAWRYLLPDE